MRAPRYEMWRHSVFLCRGSLFPLIYPLCESVDETDADVNQCPEEIDADEDEAPFFDAADEPRSPSFVCVSVLHDLSPFCDVAALCVRLRVFLSFSDDFRSHNPPLFGEIAPGSERDALRRRRCRCLRSVDCSDACHRHYQKSNK